MFKFIYILLASALMLTACASSPDSRQTSAAPAANDSITKTRDQITDVAATPLNDLNLVHADIPAVLIIAQQAPYLPPVVQTCEALMHQVAALDAVLGADVDAPEPSRPSLIMRGTTAVSHAAVGAFRGAAEAVVPYRSWVRKLTGAERYTKEVAAAITAGTARRAFLKGVGHARGCVFAVPVVDEAGALFDSELPSETESAPTPQ